MAFDASWFDQVQINLPAVKRRAAKFSAQRSVKKQWQAAWLLRAVTCIDLTTLSGDDSETNTQRLCFKAANPIMEQLLEPMDMHTAGLTTGAVCVYPSRVAECVRFLKSIGAGHIPVASVATGFPAGQTHLKTRLEEIKMAVEDGAREIDIVINRQYVFAGNWQGIYDEVHAMKGACGTAHMKAILATGELGSMQNVYRASMVCMMAGADFIKTSTGKESVNAILPVGLVMIRAIRDYFEKTGIKVGFKPAGGIRTAKDVLSWFFMMKEELGVEYTSNDLFRVGASGLLGDIERQIFHHVKGRYAAAHELPMS